MWIIGLIRLIILIKTVDNAILDSRCYLEGGGSAESFLASEDLEIGAVIGTLRINGNPDVENGDINLSLRERIAPVQIIPGTKDLALTIKLDKEGMQGPSSIYVNVICLRRHSTDPSFVIPVNVRVMDVNDNAPEWIGTPHTLTLSEVTVPGTRILQGARAEDADQHGPYSTIEYHILPGPYSEYVQFLNPLEGTLVLRKALDYETMRNFTVEMRAQDQGTPPKYTDATLNVVITDADDQNPKFLAESYTADLDGRLGELNIRPEAIKAVDQDEGICAPIQYSIVQSQDTKNFRINPQTGVITVLKSIGYADLANGATLVIKATQINNPDRYALTTVAINRPIGTHSDINSLAFVQKKFYMRIREDTVVGNRILALPTNKPGKPLKYFIPDPVNSQLFNVGSLGELILIKPLDYEKMTRHDFQVYATDGMTNATADVSLEVTDVNDWEPRFRNVHYEFIIPKKQTSQSQSASLNGILIGKVEAADGDRSDKVNLSLRGVHANLFEIDGNGNIFMRPEQLTYVNESTIHLIGIATDTGVPPRSTSVPITIKLEGVALAHTTWTNNILNAFCIIVAISISIILALTIYIVHFKSKSRKSVTVLGRNKVHSHGRNLASANSLVTHEKLTSNGNVCTTTNSNISLLNPKHNSNITMANPINNTCYTANSMGNMTTSAILAANLNRDHDKERQKENYTATVRNIVSRASANGQLYEEDEIRAELLTQNRNISKEISNKKTAWESPAAQADPNGIATVTHINHHSNSQHNSLNGSTNLLTTADDVGSSENNLTVYF